MDVTVKCEPLRVPGKQQTIDISVNDKCIALLKLETKVKEYDFKIPKKFLALGNNILTFSYAYCRTPKSLKINNDKRMLGIKLYSINFDKKRKDCVSKAPVQFTIAKKVDITRAKIGKDIRLGYIQYPNAGFSFNKCYIPLTLHKSGRV